MWNVFDEMERMHQEMERLFNRTFTGLDKPMLSSKEHETLPALYRTPITNVHETDKEVVVQFEMPGVDKKDIKVNVSEFEVEVKAEQKQEKKEEKKDYYRYESRNQSFYRRIPLPIKVNSDKAEAEFKNGVLRIELPKAKEIEQSKRKLLIK